MKSIVFTLFLLPFASIASNMSQQNNKEIVRRFYHLAFNEHKPREAAKLYIGKIYIQHNPHAHDGVGPFIEFFEKYYKESGNKNSHVIIKRMIAEEDLVVVHSHSKGSPIERGHAVVDIFRLKDGKIVEHWDVMQEVPKKLAHDNTMF